MAKEGHLMSLSSCVRRALVAASASGGALLCAAVLAAPASALTPGGIYSVFTKSCPQVLMDPRMATSLPGDATGCISSINTSGTFSIHGIPVQITHPVTVQFGVFSSPESQTNPACNGNQFCNGVVMPPDNKSLLDSPEPTPGGLPLLLQCPGSNPDIAALCTKAQTSGHTDLFALVQPAGNITNFALTSFTEPVKIQLINPVLGGNCYIGSNSNPIVLNPTITSFGNLAFTPDPNPTRFPNTAVLEITDATATDTTFTVPVATGCGPGGVADAQIDSILGLPSPSGANSLTLNGNSYFADDFSQSNQARELFTAIQASSVGP
jgi:hypothetical protein